MNRLWQELEGDWQSVQDELLAAAALKGLTTDQNLRDFWVDLKPDYDQRFAVTQQWLTERGFTLKTMNWIALDSESADPSIHIDQTSVKARINIPLLGCEHTDTVFYSLTGEYQLYTSKGSGIGYYRYAGSSEPQELARFTLSRPTVIRVSRPHKIEYKNSGELRLCASLVVDPDPVFLLDRSI